jgi:hypothetical protein
MSGGKYSVGFDFGDDPNPSYVESSVYWVIAIISQGTLLTYSRKTAGSVFQNLANDPIINTSHPLIISDDCLSMSVSGDKRNPSPTFQATLKQTDTNYLIKIFPGDYLFAWMVNNRDKYLDLLGRLRNLQPCNKASDGLKFVGRVEDVRKRLTVEGAAGHKNVSYSLTATGFSELQTYFFYDYSLASNDAQDKDLGSWLARLGVDYQTLFGQSSQNGIEPNNINKIIPTLLNLIVGSGPSKKGNISVPAFGGDNVTATPTLANEAPYAYVIPLTVGKLLGKGDTEVGKPMNVLAYADILELIIGIQAYSQKSGLNIFAPDFDLAKSTPNRKITTKPMLGTFLPYMTEFTNVPVWSLLQKYLNPTINEMYATLRINSDGNVVPTIICRQRPLTTEAFQDAPVVQLEGPIQAGQQDVYQQAPLDVTKFLDLPRWLIPNALITSVDVGRSNISRTNLVHIYGAASLMTNNVAIGEQIITNPPIIDQLSVQAHGLHPQMQTVECFVSDEVGRTPTAWMRLVADYMMGSHLLLTGTVQCLGIQSPIAIGDALEHDGVVYMIEGVSHNCGIDPMGKKFFRTSLQLTNGLSVNGQVDNLEDYDAYGTIDDFATQQIIYAGLPQTPLTDNDPGLSLEGGRTFGGVDLASQLPSMITKFPDTFSSLDEVE